MTQAADPLAPWTGDVHAARELQTALAARVSLRDDFPRTLRTVAGCDVGFEDDGATTRAAVALLEAETLQLLEQHVARLPTAMPDIPGLQSFRELPALLDAFSRLARTPDLVFVHGHGIAHPRRLGIAAHFGVATGLPSVGVASEIQTGTTSMPLHEMRGAFVPLRDGREQIGWLLRSKVGCLPLAVSPGHRVAMASAAEVVMRCVRGDRLPEPTRLADLLGSRGHP